VLWALALPAVSGAADMSKTLRVTFQVAETGFDPTGRRTTTRAWSSKPYSNRLLTYDYLARPSKLVPLAAESLPQITDKRQNLHVQDQEGYLFHPRPGVQRQEAGAYGGGLRLFDQAFFRSEEPLAVRVPVRGKDRRAR